MVDHLLKVLWGCLLHLLYIGKRLIYTLFKLIGKLLVKLVGIKTPIIPMDENHASTPYEGCSRKSPKDREQRL